jgi:hypothetical protein
MAPAILFMNKRDFTLGFSEPIIHGWVSFSILGGATVFLHHSYIDNKTRKQKTRTTNRIQIKRNYPPPTKPRKPWGMLITTPVLQMCRADLANWCVPYTINWRIITRITNTPMKRTTTGRALNATSPRKDVSEMEETSAQKVGTREDSEKKTCESYTSWERCYGT